VGTRICLHVSNGMAKGKYKIAMNDLFHISFDKTFTQKSFLLGLP
jgi:hypothetical protein